MNNGFLGHLAESFSIIAPILVVLGLGALLRRWNWIDSHFVAIANKLTFLIFMPSLLFLVTATRPLTGEVLPLAVFAVLITIVVVIAIWLVAPYLVGRDKRGAFTQSAFRSNMGMIGLALCVNAYGEDVLARAGIFVAAMIVTVNVLSVLVLTPKRSELLKNQLRNPLLIGIVSGIAWQGLHLPMPEIAENSMAYFARMALPLALLCIGASLDWSKLRRVRGDVAWAALLKMVITPLFITAVAVWWGFRGEDLGILFLMVSAPTAAVAFVMARQLTPHGDLAADSIAVTTIVSPLTVTIGLTLLSSLHLI